MSKQKPQSKKKTLADLAQQISKGFGTSEPVEPEPEVKAEVVSKKAKAESQSSGKQCAVWFNDEDRALLMERGMLLYGNGIKPNDNLVLRAALRLMATDHRFIEMARELMKNDGRKTRHQG